MSSTESFMIKRIKRQSYRKQIRKILEDRDVSKRNSKLSTLGFLVDEGYYGNLEFLRELGVDLGLNSKDIKIFTFLNTSRKISSLRVDQITNKEFSWSGEIKNSNAQEFLNNQFDVLIGIYKNPNDLMDLMVARSQANFKIGFEDVKNEVYDLILKIDPREDQEFKSELKKYLKILNKI